jgi:hypothetical protein
MAKTNMGFNKQKKNLGIFGFYQLAFIFGGLSKIV